MRDGAVHLRCSVGCGMVLVFRRRATDWVVEVGTLG